jgi:predicted Zn finger-like uncharacterized protein
MALATICPHCNTTFRVASDQLKLRGGIVRCGACHEVFDGNAALIDLDAVAPAAAETPAPEAVSEPVPPTEVMPDEPESEAAAEPPVLDAVTGTVPSSDIAPVEPESVAAPEPSASSAFDAEVAAIEAKQTEGTDEPVFTIDFDTTFDPFGIMPKPPEPEPESEQAEPEAEPEPASESETAPVAAPAADEEIVALAPPDDGPDHKDHTPEPAPAAGHDEPDLLASLLMRESAAAEPSAATPHEPQAAETAPARRKSKRKKPAPQPAVEIEPEAAPEDDEPEFVRRIRQQEATGRSRRILLGAACALLVLALAVQAMTTFRNVLAARYPDLKPVLAATCALFGCKVELPAQIDMLSVETGELQTLGANTFSYATLLRNQGDLAQAWPHIELALTDANDKPVVRRVFAPADYLPPGVAAAKGFAPRSEQPVKLFFELNQTKASGYHIAIFYP